MNTLRPDDHMVSLLGRGWGVWRGGWCSRQVLEGRQTGWRLVDDGREVDAWPTLAAAAAALWPGRTRADAAPWAVGWTGYEACAELAGGLPARADDGTRLRGWWLIEPRASASGELQHGFGPADPTVEHSLSDGAFRSRVARIRDRVAAGAVYQTNLTRRFSVHDWRGGLAPVLAAARRGGDPAYLAACRGPDGEMVCASMELLLRRRGRCLETRPIKGTRPRGRDRAEDLRLRDELDGDAKERAELAMVVDLERHDLGRIAEVGSVVVRDPGRVRCYASVLHRVARVGARCNHALPWWQLLAVMAPGGSVTGCPKIAAMQLIRELEGCPRGPYTGVFGVVAGNGDLELALPIRTAWQVGSTLHFAAGCGIVWESNPAREERESRLKVARWLELVQ